MSERKHRCVRADGNGGAREQVSSWSTLDGVVVLFPLGAVGGDERG